MTPLTNTRPNYHIFAIKPKERKLYAHLSSSTLQVQKVSILDCKYTVVKQVVKSMKMTSSKDSNSDWDLTWTDGAVSAELLARMKNYQKINHFPGMFQLSRKNYLARNIAKMYKKYPE